MGTPRGSAANPLPKRQRRRLTSAKSIATPSLPLLTLTVVDASSFPVAAPTSSNQPCITIGDEMGQVFNIPVMPGCYVPPGYLKLIKIALATLIKYGLGRERQFELCTIGNTMWDGKFALFIHYEVVGPRLPAYRHNLASP
ncbi:hypothetical protein CcaverHIS641_0500030 [Cutaneotrichosporon cavernicola]|nr:hypothetical protein CcaverHIS641_0500030 [Cutaneotrichosporon cavernicola]